MAERFVASVRTGSLGWSGEAAVMLVSCDMGRGGWEMGDDQAKSIWWLGGFRVL